MRLSAAFVRLSPNAADSRISQCSLRARLQLMVARAHDLFPLPQIAETLAAFAQPPHKHLTVRRHFAQETQDWPMAEIEATIHALDRILNLVGREMAIAKSRYLDTIPREQCSAIEPSVGSRLFIEFGARVGSGDRDLNRERVDLLGEPDRLFD